MNYTTKYFNLSSNDGLFLLQILTDFDALESAPQIAALRGIEGNAKRGLYFFEMVEDISAFDIECNSNLDAFLYEHSDSGFSEDLSELTQDMAEASKQDFIWERELLAEFCKMKKSS